MGPTDKELAAKENGKPVAGFKTFMNVFRPIREWLNVTRQPKTSTPISAPILRSSSANGPLRQHTSSMIRGNNQTSLKNNNSHNNANTSTSNSYGGDSMTGSSGDMLSTAAPTPIHHLQQTQQQQQQTQQNQQHQIQQHYSTIQQRFTPVMNGHANGYVGGGTSGMLNSLDDHQLNGSTGTGAGEVSGMGSTLEINQQFSRTAQSRMSLPIMQQNKLRRQAYTQLQRRGPQQMARSMGHIYLQHKGETKQANLPNELTTIDTIRALFVCAFPHMLTMEYMSQPHVKIYIYNPSCNIFYELCDIQDVRHESVLRIHHSDPMGSIALASQVSMVSLNSSAMGHIGHHPHNPYSTLHRLPPRHPQQLPQPLPQQNPNQTQQQQQSRGQSPQSQQQQQPQQHHQPMAMGVPMLSHPHPLMAQPMMAQHLVPPITQPQLHHSMQGQPMMVQQLSQIPPPKPRRMIPASYSLQRIPAHQSQ